MLENKEILAGQLLEVALRWKLTSYSGDWEFRTVEAKPFPVDFHWAGWNQTMAHIASVLKPHRIGVGNSISSVSHLTHKTM